MSTPTVQAKLAENFHALHVKGKPVVLYNVWDAGTARVVAGAGAKAIATGSFSVAAANGYGDGQAMPLALALENLTRIVAVAATADLPVTIDLEAGYGDEPEVVAQSVSRALAAGAIGFNLEDQMIGRDGLYSIADQTARLQAARKAADALRVPAFINARTDVFLKAPADTHDDALLDEVLTRARAYAQAGASGVFAPGLKDEKLIAKLCSDSTLPVNIMMMPSAPSAARLAELGVARISYGPVPYRQLMKQFEAAAQAIYAA